VHLGLKYRRTVNRTRALVAAARVTALPAWSLVRTASTAPPAGPCRGHQAAGDQHAQVVGSGTGAGGSQSM
jgi:hypothetical protein